MIAAPEKLALQAVRADPAGNVTLLVLTEVPARLRAAAALALLRETDAEQVGFVTAPVLGGHARLEMMGGEFCGNALRCLGLWYALHRGEVPADRLLLEISGCDRPLRVTADPDSRWVRAELPLPVALEAWNGLPTAVFPGIVHALCRDMEPTRAHAALLTAKLAERYGVPAAGVMYLDTESRFLRPAVYVRDTDTLVFESSCASGSAAAAALLSEGGEGCVSYTLRQPGGAITAAAERRSGRVTGLSISGSVELGEPFTAQVEAE